MSKPRKVTWMGTVVITPDDKGIMIFVNQLYSVPDDGLCYKGTWYTDINTTDEVKKHGILRKIYLKEI